MRLAIAHDWLDRPVGGAERVALEMAAMWPDAPVYTLLWDRALYGAAIDPGRVRTSWLQSLPEALRRRPRYLLPLIPTAVEQWDLSAYDAVLTSSCAFVKNIVTTPRTLHVCYCHSPMRFVWDYWPRYLDEQRVGPLRGAAVRVLASGMRVWDHSGASRVDVWLANSATTARRLRKYYGVDSRVLHPGVDVASLRPTDPRAKSDEWLCLATLTPYKRIDVAIAAFNATRRRLVVAGDGPERGRLESLAGPTIRFTGHVGDAERAALLSSARGLVFPSEEDFGIAPVEAMGSGTPVVALAAGGLRETVVDGVTGVFFAEQTPAALNTAVERLEGLRGGLVLDDLVDRAAQFSVERFRRELRGAVEQAYAAHSAER
ncbi:MAG TPA: glycosyltransferase [Candidatus Dormibacteraeota bacterium]|nr:glycosyltransferase [Candidatus Dormibacteraeota bacterium]